MSTATIIISITYAVTSSLALHQSYKHPVPGELTPYLHLVNLLPIWTQIIFLWTTRPVPIRWISRLGRIVKSEDRGTFDTKVVEVVDRALVTYQTNCAFLVGIIVVPFIWISRHNAIQRDEPSANAGYKSIVLWLIVLGTWVGCYALWNEMYRETYQRITALVGSSTATTSSDTKPASTSSHELQSEK